MYLCFQVYPAVEYDFVPNKLTLNKETDVLHIQWAGMISNPASVPNIQKNFHVVGVVFAHSAM